MNHIDLFNKLLKVTGELGLSLKIETERGSAFSIWVYSHQYSDGKHISIEELEDIDKIDFKEIAANNNVKRFVEDLVQFGYSKQEIEERFLSEIYADCMKDDSLYKQPCIGDCVRCSPYGGCLETKENETSSYAKVF